jgi:putative protein-disulfide isomerase
MHMMKATLIYLYDALCGWCYGFSPVITRLRQEYAGELDMEIYSGGMVLGENAGMVSSETAAYILQAIPKVEEYTGIQFGQRYRQQLEEGSLYQSSLKPAIALSVFKNHLPEEAVFFAAALQKAAFLQGESLEADDTYRKLLEAYPAISSEQFLQEMHTENALHSAYEDFRYAAELGATGFPALLGCKNDHYYWLSRGYQPYEQLKNIVERFKAV